MRRLIEIGIAVAVAVLLAGLLLEVLRRQNTSPEERNRREKPILTKGDIADLIDRHLDGRAGNYEWDDFETAPFKDPELEAIRHACAAVLQDYPWPGRFCSEAGEAELRRIAAEIRNPES